MPSIVRYTRPSAHRKTVGIRVVPRIQTSSLLGWSFFHTKKYAFKERRKKMKDRLEQIKAQALEQIKASDMPEKLNEVRVKFLGKKEN